MTKETPLYQCKISKFELLELASSRTEDIPVFFLNQWLRSITKDKYVILPKDHVHYLEKKYIAINDVVDEVNNYMSENTDMWVY